MPTTTREQAAAALFTLVTNGVNAALSPVSLKTALRRKRLPEDISPPMCPAFLQIQTEEDYQYRHGGMIAIPPIRTLIVDLHLYITDANATAAGIIGPPSTQLNALVQAVEASLAPDAVTGRSTLGGLVTSCRIEGKIGYLEAERLDSYSMVMIPVSILFP